jgi:phage terminase small subunit
MAPSTKGPLQARQHGLSARQYAFCLEWVANGFNATQAYLKSHKGVLYLTAVSNGSRMLRNAKVAAFLEEKVGGVWKPLEMSGEEALARVAQDARADHRFLYDAKGKILHPSKWPDEIANSLESYKVLEDGRYEIKFVSKGQARRVILETTGKLQGEGSGLHALAAALREDLDRADKARKENPNAPRDPAPARATPP